MIREELIHPAISHFPLALLVLVMFTKTAQFFVTEKYTELKKNLALISKFLLLTGSAFLLPTLFLGDMAFDAVKSDVCNFITVYRHEDLGHYTLVTFIVAIVFDTLIQIKQVPAKLRPLLNIATLITIFLGNYFLLNTANLGGELVYEQGVAVKAVKKDCSQINSLN